MRYLLLPLHFISFWYQEALIVWIRILRNTLWFLEEDLAVKLMLKLLFVPLFHDSTIVGRVLSIIFRLFRVFIGLFAFAFFSLVEILMMLFWFLTPLLAIFPSGLLQTPFITLDLVQIAQLISRVLLFSGGVLFIHHLISHPEKKLMQVKNVNNLWQASFVQEGKTNFKSLLSTFDVKNLLQILELSPESFTNFSDNVSSTDLQEKVWNLGKSLMSPYLEPEHFFVARLSLIPDVVNTLAKMNLNLEDFKDALDFLQKKREAGGLSFLWSDDFHVKHLSGVNRGWLGVPTPELDLVSEDLTQLASSKRVEDFIGRDNTVNQVVNLLSSDADADVILVGEAGAGKTTLVRYLAKLIVSGDAPDALATKRLVAIDFTKLLTGVKTQGDLAEKVNNIFAEVKYSQNIILFIDEIENLGIGEAASEFNLFALMLPFLESDDFQFIASTEPQNYTKVLEKNSSFARIFTKVEVPAATVDDTLSIIEERAIEAEWKKIKTTVPAMKEIVKLANLYVHDRVLPDSAISIFNQTLVKNENGWVTKNVVDQIVSMDVKVPVGEVEKDKKDELLNMEVIIHKKLIDQVEAVSVVSKTLRRSATNLRDQNRPIGSFLFVGPTGVGKTELAKILAQIYFKGGGQFLRFDMSEYQTPESVAKLIGKTDEEGQLTEQVRHNPYSLLLLDEFEKADPKILTIFLQVLDDGRLTDGTGKTVDFTNTIIIATSNAGSVTLAEGLKAGKGLSELQQTVEDELIKIFHPELVNRFDEVVLFKPLSEEDLQKVVQLKLADLQKRLEEQGYLVNFSQDLVQKLAQKGYDPVLGARPLRRLIQDTLEARFSVLILEGKLPKGQLIEAKSDLLLL